MLTKQKICPKCLGIVKTLKHSVKCNCGIRIKTINSK